MTDTQVGKGVAQALADFQAAHKLTLENIALRQQLAESKALSAYRGQQLAEKEAEIARLKEEVRVTKEEDFPRKAEAVANNWRIKLAASQLREQQLREALDAVQQVANSSEGIAGWHMNGDIASWDSILPEVEQALDIPTDDTALREMIAKAGEVMRDRAIQCFFPFGSKADEKIRALPGVTTEDLK